jgi:hypothetical protein
MEADVTDIYYFSLFSLGLAAGISISLLAMAAKEAVALVRRRRKDRQP